MNPYGRFQPGVVEALKKLNEELEKETKQAYPDNDKIFKLRYQILMKGMELSVPYSMNNHNPYR